ncbi:MAG: hypothetical protein HYX89_04850 [Chloroflexi bacterium]|nr:hypothetical protein [Chloroflexota bacterium]
MVSKTISRENELDGPALGSTDLFLSPKWVHEVTRVIQGARRKDKEFGKLASGFSLSLAYLITDVPEEVRELYGGDKVAVFLILDKGTIRKLSVGTELPGDNSDFTVTSNYQVAKKVFLGELNAATSFINKEIRVEPLSRIYRDPPFTAKSIVTGNKVLKIARAVPTVFPAED